MENIAQLEKYFPGLSEKQLGQFRSLKAVYEEWNAKINVISRRDMDNFYVHHVLHSLALSKIIQFRNGTSLLDAGTGGGFPGIPLAIMYPDSDFMLVDSIGKKIKVVDAVCLELGLNNVKTLHSRVEEVPGLFDFVLSRAVAPMSDLYRWTSGKIKKGSSDTFQHGFFFWKGGDLRDEIHELAKPVVAFELSDFFEEEFFSTKKIVYVRKEV